LNGVPVKGGLVFTDDGNRTRYDTSFRGFQPRFGLAYKFRDKMVIRASYGLSMLPNNEWGSLGARAIDQTGYSVSTPFVDTLGAGIDSFIPNRPGTGSFDTPFPTGFLQPTRNRAGLKTFVGQGVSYISPDFAVPRVHQFQLGIEREIPWQMTMEASYVGSRTRKYRVSRNINIVPIQEQLAALGNANYFNRAVPNPYFGAPELVGTAYNAPTLTNEALLRPFPQFTSVNMLGIPSGSVDYDSLETRLRKRLSHGVLFTASYTFSKRMSALAYRTNWDADPLRQIDSQDVPHHISVATFWDLPIGTGKALGTNWSKSLDRLLGNWRFNLTVEKVSGYPIAIPAGTVPLADPLAQKPTDGRLFQTCSMLRNGTRFNCASATEPVYWRQDNFNELTTHSTRWAQVREPTRATWNISLFKGIPLNERIKAEIRAEAFNAFNTPQYNAPSAVVTNQFFGRVLQDQWNYPRNLQFAARILF
jgi:hypothetical protein